MTGDNETTTGRHVADQLDTEGGARRVTEVLQQIRAGVRQRQAEQAANLSAQQLSQGQNDQWSPIDERIADLQARAVVAERPFVSHMPLLGPLITFVRRTWNSVSTKWFVLPMVQQQNEFNQLVVHTLHQSLTTQAQLGRRLNGVNARLDESQAKIDEIKQYLDARVREAEQHLEQLDLRLISSDRDLTGLARKIAEREYKVREWNAEAAEERVELADRLDELQNVLAALSDGID